MNKTDIIIPTMDNPQQLGHTVLTMFSSMAQSPIRIIVVNNGDRPIKDVLPASEDIVITSPGSNVNWHGGLIAGLALSSSEYVVFSNDDISIPVASRHWLKSIIAHMDADPKIAAEGPSSNVVMGAQSIFHGDRSPILEVPFLIGFFVVVRRSALDAIGGIDPLMDTGDDLDISIRFRKAGYKLIARKDLFVFHHGFQTGHRVYGTPDVPGGWNSPQMQNKTNKALQAKHGFHAWWQTLQGSLGSLEEPAESIEPETVGG